MVLGSDAGQLRVGAGPKPPGPAGNVPASGRRHYVLVNKQKHPTEDLEITFAEKGPAVWCDPANGRFTAVDAKDGRFIWRFDTVGSAMFVVGAEAEVPAPAVNKSAEKNMR